MLKIITETKDEIKKIVERLESFIERIKYTTNSDVTKVDAATLAEIDKMKTDVKADLNNVATKIDVPTPERNMPGTDPISTQFPIPVIQTSDPTIPVAPTTNPIVTPIV